MRRSRSRSRIPRWGGRRCSRASRTSISSDEADVDQHRIHPAATVTTAESALDLARLVSLRDFEPIARRVMDPASYDYIAGGSWDEVSLAESEAAWRRRTLRPRVLVDVAAVDTATTLLGEPATMPVAIAPMALHGLAHPDGEVVMAQ